MEKKEFFIAIVIIIGTAIGTGIGSTISETELLKPKSEFLIEFDSKFGNATVGEKITFWNIGNAQAKNAVLFIRSSEPIKMSSSSCPESFQLPNSENVFLEIKFQKLSTKIGCVLEFASSSKGNIIDISASADDSDGYLYEFNTDKKKEEFIIPSFLESTEWTFALIITSYTVAGIATLTLIVSRNEVRKRLENFRRRESELRKQLSQTNNELKSIGTPVDEKGISHASPENIQRKALLSEKSYHVKNRLDAIRAITNMPILYTPINLFFENWYELSKQLRLLSGVLGSKQMYDEPMKKILDEIKNKELLPTHLINKIDSIHNFRNSLVHESKKSNKKEIESYNISLNELLNEINQIRPPPQNIVQIPFGSSVPGCEEHQKCFIPYKKEIKENEIITWVNIDNAAHTVTSGIPSDSNSVGTFFDSSLFLASESFSHKFKKKGTYHYFCIVHPWQRGIIEVT